MGPRHSRCRSKARELSGASHWHHFKKFALWANFLKRLKTNSASTIVDATFGTPITKLIKHNFSRAILRPKNIRPTKCGSTIFSVENKLGRKRNQHTKKLFDPKMFGSKHFFGQKKCWSKHFSTDEE